MNPRYKTNLLEHAKAVAQWARSHGAHSAIDGDDLTLRVRRGPREVLLRPQFVAIRAGGRMAYVATPEPTAIGMVGWFGYPVQGWPISKSKREFKRVAAQLGIDVPPWWSDSREATGPYLIKPDGSAFGYGIRGPFAPGSTDPRARTGEGEYADAFKSPRIARAWYWGATLAVLELFDMPVLTGDGTHTFTALLQQALAADATLPAGHADLATLQGHAADAPVPAGTRVLVDYRYVSPFNPTVYANHNVLARIDGSPLHRRFAEAGRLLWPLLPGAGERRMAFVLDAIVDNAERAWFLEINSNPQLHPDLYPVMLSDLLPEPR